MTEPRAGLGVERGDVPEVRAAEGSSSAASAARTAAYSAACSTGATSPNQSAPRRPWPPASSRSKRWCGDAFTTILDRYLQLTR